MNVNYKALALGLGSTLFAASCSNDEIEQVNRGTEITFNTAVTRAAVETTASLKEFKVWAQSVGYEGTMLIDGQVAKKQTAGGQNYFKIDDPIYWPSDIAQINFWAVSPKDININMDQTTKVIKFTPDSIPSKQKDLIVAYTPALRSVGTNVNLNFNHALSQIIVKAKRGEVHKDNNGKDETKAVTIKGAWIVNVLPTGELSFVNDEKKHYMQWNDLKGTKCYYGNVFNTPVNLTGHDAHNVLAETPAEKDSVPANGNNLMLVPQQLSKWDLDSEDKTTNNKQGAYILFLCRVTAEHQGSTHSSGTKTTGGVQEGNNTHTHQLFPYTGNYDNEEYGFSCIPINTTWEPGKKYIYTLEFCGPTSGAGIYPPQTDVDNIWKALGENKKYIKTIPKTPGADDKQKTVGDPVLDQPIRFTVEVESWEEWTDGNMGMK
ncbi:fimbrillin family protein [uncultured Bacteroides sp.]|uniref:fimbrillin family protein n=1 Tax=uncultured Bacteroides sp. TaxID=162156 RepID=UPI00261D909A|nr:fimbrillin family protein [uncultured Bacteroides sp.]